MEVPECPICLEPYDLVSRVPMTLTNCGHSICNADLAILPGNACPMCKVSIKSKPIKNYALMQLLESQGKTPAMVKCRPHSLPFEFWCEECSCLCCPKCFLNTHKGHTMQGLEEAMDQNREFIEELFELGESALEEMTRQVQHCHDRRTLAGAAKEALKRDIDGHCDMLIKAIEQRRQDLLLLMERHPALSGSHHDGEERTSMDRQEALSLQLREARAMWERRDVRLLVDAPILTDELYAIIAGSSETSRGEAPPCMVWRARFEDPSSLLEQIRGLGALQASVSSGTCSVAIGEGLERAVVGGSASFVVTTYDVSGARRTTGGEEVVVDCQEAGGFEYRIADGGNGTYEVTYRVEGKGPVEGPCSVDLHVHVGAQPVLGSPWKVQLLPAFQGLHAVTLGTRGTGLLQFQGPAAIAVDAACIYIADGDNHRIQVLDASTGAFVMQMGRPELDLRTTYGVAVDDSCLYVAERDFHRVTVLDKATGRFRRTLGEGSGLKEPLAVAVYGNLVAISDTVKHRVMLFDKVAGGLIRSIGPALVRGPGGSTRAQDQMLSSCDVAFDSAGLLYVTDREGSRILVFQPSNGTFLRQFGSQGTGPGQFNHVNRVFVTEDRVYGTDRFGARVLMFDKATGAFLSTFGSGLLERPNGIAVVKGRVLVGDFARNCLQVFT